MESDHLCNECADIDLEKVFRGGYETPQQLKNLGSVPESQLSSPCPLCRLVAEAIYRPFCDASLASYHQSCGQCDRTCSSEEPESASYYLLAVELNTEDRDGMGHSRVTRYRDALLQTEKMYGDVCFSKSTHEERTQMSTHKLENGAFITLKIGRLKDESPGIAYYGSIYLASGSLQSARLLSYPMVDWDLLRSFLNECQTCHTACSSSREKLQIEKFLLIDCNSKQLTQAEADKEYVALSYVWGQPERNVDPVKLQVGSELPKTAPVIEDAIKAVIELGYQYLWVDRYCIPQNDPSALEDHLSKMHLVYQHASVTIIAAAGVDSSFGLPGVDARPRDAQTHAQIDGHLLVSAVEQFLPSSNCKWNSRAWTYQEGLFAARQLIFESHQVSFHCTQAQKSEIFTTHIAMHEDSLFTLGSQARSIWEHIEHFATRSLTYEFDALNAIKATLNSFDDHTKENVTSVWGIPVSKTITPLDHNKPSTGAGLSGKTGMLSNASFASASAVFAYGLAWRMSLTTPEKLRTLRRRTDFPTWSWASCIGHITFPRLPWLIDKNVVMPDAELDVALESFDGRIVPIADYLTDPTIFEPLKYLHVEGWSVRDALTFHLGQGVVSLDLGDGKYELTGSIQFDTFPNDASHENIFNILSERRNSKKRWEAIIVWFAPKDDTNAINPFILTLVEAEDPKHTGRKVYERIGNVPLLRLERMPKKRRGREARSRGPIKKNPRMTVKWAAEIMSDKDYIPYDATKSIEETEVVEEVEDEEPETDDDSSGNERTSEESDSSDMGDYTINMVINRWRATKYYPRIPMVRRKFILR